MTKVDRLYKLSQGSDTAIWACDEILRQDERIAELEKERDEYLNSMKLMCLGIDKLHHSTNSSERQGAFNAINTAYYDRPSNIIEAHNLEQQAKGINDFGKWVLDTDKNASGLDVRDIDLIEFYIEHLRKQAKALKEQGK